MEKFKSFMIQTVLYPVVFNSLFAKLVFKKQLVLLFYYYCYYFILGGGGSTEKWDKKLNLNCQTKRKSIYFWNSNSKTLKILEFNLQSVRTRNDHQNKERKKKLNKKEHPRPVRTRNGHQTLAWILWGFGTQSFCVSPKIGSKVFYKSLLHSL